VSLCRNILTILVVLVLAGCAVYSPKPLPAGPSFSRDISHVSINSAEMTLPGLAAHRFDPSNGLDMTEVAMLAVVNNPELKLARDDCGIARAQAFAAGLLPDPQLSASLDIPTNKIAGSNYTAYGLGLNYDIFSLFIRSIAKRAAAAESRKTDLTLLWQEWQVTAQARLFFIRNLEQVRLMKVLEENRYLLADRYEHAAKALEEGNLTLDAASSDLAALQDAKRQISDLSRKVYQNRFDLNQLVGVDPGMKLHLVGDASLPPLDDLKIKEILPHLAERRPDLLALKAGYGSQDLKFRKAVLEQFPALNIGIARARDTSDVNTIGFGITMNIPLFNRNRGNVAIEKATRKRLYDEYQMRLNRAYGDIEQLLADQRLTERQLSEAKEGLSLLTEAAANAEAAYKEGDIDVTSYLNLRLALANKRIEEIGLEQLILEQRVALQTLIGGELPLNSKYQGEGS
jgi:outer membrane protein TolC